MFRKLLLSALGTAAVAVAGVAHSQEPVKIGFITTLTTPAGYIGEDQRDAFNLAIKQGQGNLGGVPVNLIVADDALKPSNGKQLAEKMLQDGVKLFTGINFSNVLTAVAPTVLRRDGFYVSVNPGPSPFAGDKCDENYFVASYENTTIHAAAGEAASQMGYKRMAVLAPNYQAGRD